MKILYVTTIGTTMGFFKEFIGSLINDGHTVDIATNEETSPVPEFYYNRNCKVFGISTSRSPFSLGNFRAIKQIRQIVIENGYDIVHCHTPLAAAATRLACRPLRKKGLKVFYTAHGFHFYKGAPIKNWLIFYPIEKICSYFTDVLITINKEDYDLAKRKFRAKKTEHVEGVGIDLSEFGRNSFFREQKREELGIPEDAKLLLSVGELNENKNHETVIKAIKDFGVYYIIAGEGALHEHLQKLIDEQDLTDKVKLLGYRDDVSELYSAADIFVFPSFREGLSVALMEAMASGLLCAVSKIRGNVDLIDYNGGSYFNPTDAESCKLAIEDLMKKDCISICKYNAEKIKTFSRDNIVKKMKKMYYELGVDE
ncbi:MAG: glycosyltransferase [Oscillospiraceae bacterium]|nr:glycosyltransferase [Oscillospiraceae bacterium]